MKNIKFMKVSLGVILTYVLFLFSCTPDSSVDEMDTKDYIIGKNRYTLTLEGKEREFYVHVPTSYDEQEDLPMVIMLHGTSGNGLKFYNISGWKEVGEKENILTVFPSSWKHCVIQDGEVKTTTKWHIYPGGFEYCEGEVPLDDIGFLNAVIDEMVTKFKIDQKRIYLAGFSNGGKMASRCAVEMSDRLAAVVMASGVEFENGIHSPKMEIPLGIQIGTIEKFDNPMDIMDFDSLIQQPSEYHLDMLLASARKTFGYSDEYVKTGNPNNILVATYKSISNPDNLEMKFMMINKLKHMYPNGTKHPFMAAEEHWKWFKQFSKP